MNKTKYILTGFAVFASILMLTTTCIAGPVQEKTNIDAVESAQEELMKSFEAMFLKMKNDRYLNSLKDQIPKDRTLNSIASAIEKTEDFETKASLASSYADALKNNQVFNNLAAYFERSYSKDMQSINAQFNTFSDISNAYYQSINTETEEEDIVIVGVHNLHFGSQNDEDTSDTSSETGNKGTVYTCNGGIVYDTGSGWSPGEAPEANAQQQWVGFVHNMNGEMYIPGIGWVDAEEYGWLENALQNSGLPLVDIYAILFIICFFSAIISYIGIFIAVGLGLENLAVALFLVFYVFYFGTFIFFLLNQQCEP